MQILPVLAAAPGGRLLEDEPMERHTSWRVGGPARRYYLPAGADDLAQFIAGLPAAEPLLWLGLGSNLLVRDGGFPGTVIATLNGLQGLALDGAYRLRAEAGVTCAKIARISARQDWTGGEFLAGIPGTLGGALAMNAGCHGAETWSLVRSVEVMDRSGRVTRRSPQEYRIGYRSVTGPAPEWFIAAELVFRPDFPGAPWQRLKNLLQQRNDSQPTQQPSCGSVFRNPPGDHAGRLIDAAGLKGLRRGAAMVSTKHANFIVNTGGARAADIEGLIADVQAVILARFQTHLEPEARIAGAPAS